MALVFVTKMFSMHPCLADWPLKSKEIYRVMLHPDHAYIWHVKRAFLRGSRQVLMLLICLPFFCLFMGGVALSKPIAVTSKVIEHFNPLTPGRMRFGKLEWVSGLELTGPFAASFGGFSAIRWLDEARFMAISDIGMVLTARLRSDKGVPLSVETADLAFLPGLGGDIAKWKRDGEALEITQGHAIVGFVGFR